MAEIKISKKKKKKLEKLQKRADEIVIKAYRKIAKGWKSLYP